MQLDSFPESLNDSWMHHLDLLTLTCTCLKEQNNIEMVYQKLSNNSMFYTDGYITIYDDNIILPILEKFRYLLLLARYITEYLVLIAKTNIEPCEIPSLCETIERCVSSVRRANLYEDIKLEMYLCNILSAYEYMEYGKAVKSERNIKYLEEICSNDILRNILMEAFYA